ncbi:MAG TPA: hypothetical protein VFH96_02880 [Pyrinomonadaceae bacterium]|nr:hypothetical protein [Pyrinomonadaceae bacterium]
MQRRDVVEACFVTLHLWFIRQPRAQFAEDSGNVCVGWLREAIVGPFAIATSGDESGAAQVGEMTRNLWLISLQNLDTGANAQLIIAQKMNQPQPSVVREGFEECFQISMH